MLVLGPMLYFSSWKIIYIHLEIANNYTIAIISRENLEDHYEFKYTSTVNSGFKAILWVPMQLDCQFLSTFTHKSPVSRNSYFIFIAFNDPPSHSFSHHHKSILSKINIKASIFLPNENIEWAQQGNSFKRYTSEVFIYQ